MLDFQKSIGKDAAIELAESKWWDGTDKWSIAIFQLETVELCMPFGLFQEAVEHSVGHPVWTHEFGIPDRVREIYEAIKDEHRTTD